MTSSLPRKNTFFSGKTIISVISAGVQLEGVGINKMLVENDFVSLGFFDHFQGFDVCVPFDIVWIVHGDGLVLPKIW